MRRRAQTTTLSPSDQSLIQELEALVQFPPQSNAERLLNILPYVERAIASGAKQADIVLVLNAHGFSFTLGSFRTTLYRLRKRYLMALCGIESNSGGEDGPSYPRVH